MILARTATRVSELAVRTALGASRARIICQLFVESLVLALLATGIGLVLADQLVRRLAQAMIEQVPYWFDISIGPRSVLLALGLAAVCAVGAGVVPALKATSERVQRNLQGTARGGTVPHGTVQDGVGRSDRGRGGYTGRSLLDSGSGQSGGAETGIDLP